MAASSSTQTFQNSTEKESDTLESKSMLLPDVFTYYTFSKPSELKYGLLYDKALVIAESKTLPPTPEFKEQFLLLINAFSQMANENELSETVISCIEDFPDWFFHEDITGNQTLYYFKHTKQMLEEIWFNLYDRNMHFKNGKADDQNRKSVVESYHFGLTILTQLFQELDVCGPGIKVHITKARNDLYNPYSITGWLALGRTEKMGNYQAIYSDLYYQEIKKVIPEEMKPHIYTGLMRYALRQKWEPCYSREETPDIYIKLVGLDEDYDEEKSTIEQKNEALAAKKRLTAFGKVFLKSYEESILDIIQQGFVKAYLSRFPMAESKTQSGADNWIDSEEISDVLNFFKLVGFDDPHQTGYAFNYSDDMMKMRYQANLFRIALLHFLFTKNRFLNIRTKTQVISFSGTEFEKKKEYDFYCYDGQYEHAWVVDKAAAEINEASCIPIVRISPGLFGDFLDNLPLASFINFIEQVENKHFIPFKTADDWDTVQNQIHDLAKRNIIQDFLKNEKRLFEIFLNKILDNHLDFEKLDLTQLSETVKEDVILHAIKNNLCGLLLIFITNKEINLPLRKTQQTILMQAVIENKPDIIRMLLSARKDCNSNAYHGKGWTALLHAANNGKLNVVSALCEQKETDINRCFLENGMTPLMFASYHGNVEMIRVLGKREDCDMNATTTNGSTALMYASYWGQVNAVRALCEYKNCHINAVGEHGWTALRNAIEKGYTDVVRVLCEYGCDVNLKDKKNRSPLSIAFEKGYLDILRILCEQPQLIANEIDPVCPLTPLSMASKKGYLDVVRVLCERKDSLLYLNEKDKERGWTALMHAIDWGHREVVEVLIKIKACDINSVNANRSTALIVAAYFNNAEMIRILCRREDCDINATNCHGWTALKYASSHGNEQVVRELCERKDCDIDAANEAGTALMIAVERNRSNVVETLCQFKKCGINAADGNGFTPLMHAINDSTIVNILLKHPDCDINLKNNKNETALDLVEKRLMMLSEDSSSRKEEKSDYINIRNALIKMRSLDIIKAINTNQPERVKDLTFNISEINDSLFGMQDAPLIYAVRMNKPEVVKILLENSKCDINILGGKQLNKKMIDVTPVELAIYEGHIDVLKELLRNSKKDVLASEMLISIREKQLDLQAYLKNSENRRLIGVSFWLFLEKVAQTYSGDKSIKLTAILLEDDRFCFFRMIDHVKIKSIPSIWNQIVDKIIQIERERGYNFESKIVNFYGDRGFLTNNEIYHLKKKQRDRLEDPVFTHLVTGNILTPREIISLTTDEATLFRIAVTTELLLSKNESKEIKEDKSPIFIEKSLEKLYLNLKTKLDRWIQEAKIDPDNLTDKWLSSVQMVLSVSPIPTPRLSDDLYKLLKPLHDQKSMAIQAVEKILDHFGPYSSEGSFWFFSTSLQEDYLKIKSVIRSFEHEEVKCNKIYHFLISFKNKLNSSEKDKYKVPVIEKTLELYQFSPVVIVHLQKKLMSMLDIPFSEVRKSASKMLSP